MSGGNGVGGGGPPPAPGAADPLYSAALAAAAGGRVDCGGAVTIPESIQRAAELSLINDSRYGAQMLTQHAIMMMAGGCGGGGGEGSAMMAAGGAGVQYAQMQARQQLQQAPRFDAGYALNPDGTPLLDHHYRPIPLQKLLQTRPLRSDISTRPGPGNMKLTYMSGEVVTRTLNEMFGFGGWCMEVRQTTREVRDVRPHLDILKLQPLPSSTSLL